VSSSSFTKINSPQIYRTGDEETWRLGCISESELLSHIATVTEEVVYGGCVFSYVEFNSHFHINNSLFNDCKTEMGYGGAIVLKTQNIPSADLYPPPQLSCANDGKESPVCATISVDVQIINDTFVDVEAEYEIGYIIFLICPCPKVTVPPEHLDGTIQFIPPQSIAVNNTYGAYNYPQWYSSSSSSLRSHLLRETEEGKENEKRRGISNGEVVFSVEEYRKWMVAPYYFFWRAILQRIYINPVFGNGNKDCGQTSGLCKSMKCRIEHAIDLGVSDIKTIEMTHESVLYVSGEVNIDSNIEVIVEGTFGSRDFLSMDNISIFSVKSDSFELRYFSINAFIHCLFSVEEQANLTIFSCLFTISVDEQTTVGDGIIGGGIIEGINARITLADIAIKDVSLERWKRFLAIAGGFLKIERSIFRNISTKDNNVIYSGINTSVEIYESEFSGFDVYAWLGGIFDVTISSDHYLIANHNKFSYIYSHERFYEEVEGWEDGLGAPPYGGGGAFNVKGYGNFLLDVSDNYFKCVGSEHGNGGVLFLHIFKDTNNSNNNNNSISYCYKRLNKHTRIANNMWNRNYVYKGKGDNIYIQSNEIRMGLFLNKDMFRNSIDDTNKEKFWTWDVVNGFSKISDFFPNGMYFDTNIWL
jgi:hypothetical protein